MSNTDDIWPISRVLVAQLGARRHYAVARALHRQAMLGAIVTDLTADAPIWRLLDNVVPRSLRTAPLDRFLARRIEGVPRALVRDLPMFALSLLQCRRSGETQTEHWARRNAAFCRQAVAAGFGAANTVYAFNGAALEIFKGARQRGLKTVLDQTAAPWRWNRRLLEEEARRWPGWESDDGEGDRTGRMSAREEEEWSLADAIICGSDFARTAAIKSGARAQRCHVVTYTGYVLPRANAIRRADGVTRESPLRVLFVGTLQLRKGVQYLVEAAELLRGSRIEFRLVGPTRLSQEGMRRVATLGEIIGPVPRLRLQQHYDWADVLVLPTLSEGSANVCYEAMAAGLAVITTRNAGAIVQHGREGLIVPIRDAAALADAIAALADDRPRLAALGRQACITMSAATLDDYAARLGGAIGGTLVAA